VLEPALVELQEESLTILVINFHLLAGDVLDGLVLVFSVMVDDDLFDIVEHSFQFIEADVVLMSFLMHKQVLLYLIILLDS
jgi:hypothetical protein